MCGVVFILKEVVKEDLLGKVTFEPSTEGGEAKE